MFSEPLGNTSNSTGRLPELRDELQKLIRATDESLHILPKPPSEDAFAEIFHLISEFIGDLRVYLEGTPYADGLLQAIRPYQVGFKNAVRATAPEFRSQTEESGCDGLMYAASSCSDSDGDDATCIKAATFGFLASEEDASKFMPPTDDRNVITVHDVMKRAEEYVKQHRAGS